LQAIDYFDVLNEHQLSQEFEHVVRGEFGEKVQIVTMS
jgi:hypothetical protein